MIRKVPRWVWAAVLVGLGAFLALYQPWDPASDRARAAADGLRDSAVYVAPGAPELVDPARARGVVGDRAIAVAIFDDTPLAEYTGDEDDEPEKLLCEDVADLAPSNLVIVYSRTEGGEYDGTFCDGGSFPAPTEVDEDVSVFSIGVLSAAEGAWRYRVTDTNLTPQIEEYVFAFDAAAGEAYGEIPRRGPVPDALAFGQLALACLGMIAATAVLFLLLQRLARAVRHRTAAGHAATRRRKAINAKLNRLADRVLHPSGEPDAEAAKEYVLVMHQFREAKSDKALRGLEERLDALRKRFP